MVQINSHFSALPQNYIFSTIEEKVEKLQAPDLINLGIGDVALPLVPTICAAICQATQEMAASPRGYGPSTGYPFLKEAIARTYKELIDPDEIFISDGINSDATNLLELFDLSCTIGIPDPTYPAYLSNAILLGRKYKITLLPCNKASGFVPHPPDHPLDIVYLCTPGNPTGIAMNRALLASWIKYAHTYGSVLIVDAAYDAFITSPDIPRSIYELDGAKEVAIELHSFSKSAGFTALRCAYAVIPMSLHTPLNTLWHRRQSIKSNGVPYVIQKGAEAALSPHGLAETYAQVRHYLDAAALLRAGLHQLGFSCHGGVDAPYIWLETPQGMTSWQFFDTLLERCRLLTIPGCGFGSEGEGFVRFSTFTTDAKRALERLCTLK